MRCNLPVKELLPTRGIRVLSQGINSRPGASEGHSTQSTEIPMVSAERTENLPLPKLPLTKLRIIYILILKPGLQFMYL